ncbi:hypothetical protein D3C84_777650 [compost metagenome]
MTELHQRHTDIERCHAGTAQLLEKPALAALVLPGRLGIGHPEAGKDDAGHDDHQRQRIHIQAQPIEQPPQANHSKDEADRAPQADLAVACGLALQMRQGNDFELRQHRMPEERVQGHDQRQPGIALGEENQREAQQGRQRPQAYDQQAPTTAVTEPAPQIGRDTTHEHGDGHQLADPCTGKPQVMEIQRQERRCRTEQGEVEQVEAGQPPVGNRRHGSIGRGAHAR